MTRDATSPQRMEKEFTRLSAETAQRSGRAPPGDPCDKTITKYKKELKLTKSKAGVMNASRAEVMQSTRALASHCAMMQVINNKEYTEDKKNVHPMMQGCFDAFVYHKTENKFAIKVGGAFGDGLKPPPLTLQRSKTSLPQVTLQTESRYVLCVLLLLFSKPFSLSLSLSLSLSSLSLSLSLSLTLSLSLFSLSVLYGRLPKCST